MQICGQRMSKDVKGCQRMSKDVKGCQRMSKDVKDVNGSKEYLLLAVSTPFQPSTEGPVFWANGRVTVSQESKAVSGSQHHGG